ncbi:MAG: hypothetical protein QM715_18060 [Nibricoccus sp.]
MKMEPQSTEPVTRSYFPKRGVLVILVLLAAVFDGMLFNRLGGARREREEAAMEYRELQRKFEETRARTRTVAARSEKLAPPAKTEPIPAAPEIILDESFPGRYVATLLAVREEVKYGRAFRAMGFDVETQARLYQLLAEKVAVQSDLREIMGEQGIDRTTAEGRKKYFSGLRDADGKIEAEIKDFLGAEKYEAYRTAIEQRGVYDYIEKLSLRLRSGGESLSAEQNSAMLAIIAKGCGDPTFMLINPTLPAEVMEQLKTTLSQAQYKALTDIENEMAYYRAGQMEARRRMQNQIP